MNLKEEIWELRVLVKSLDEATTQNKSVLLDGCIKQITYTLMKLSNQLDEFELSVKEQLECCVKFK